MCERVSEGMATVGAAFVALCIASREVQAFGAGVEGGVGDGVAGGASKKMLPPLALSVHIFMLPFFVYVCIMSHHQCLTYYIVYFNHIKLKINSLNNSSSCLATMVTPM